MRLMKHRDFEKVRIWKKPDGKLITTVFNLNAKYDYETDEQFMDRICAGIEQAHPGFSSCEKFTKLKDEFPKVDKRKKGDYLIMEPDGSLKIKNDLP